jgi:hypothetical protein
VVDIQVEEELQAARREAKMEEQSSSPEGEEEVWTTFRQWFAQYPTYCWS